MLDWLIRKLMARMDAIRAAEDAKRAPLTSAALRGSLRRVASTPLDDRLVSLRPDVRRRSQW